jgi:hypothetical protein
MADPVVTLEKLDFDALYDEAEAADQFGECPLCERQDVILCWCGVCLSHCHGDYFHELMDEPGGP